jgi:hypothetical protein
MRASLVCVALAVGAVRAQNATAFHDKQAEELFRSSRLAVSGTPGAVTKLKTLSFKGKSRLPATSGAVVDTSVQIMILLPDHYVRIDTMASGERVEGYAGSKVFNRTRTVSRSCASSWRPSRGRRPGSSSGAPRTQCGR